MAVNHTLPVPVHRIRAGTLVRGVLARTLNPGHLWRAVQLHRARRAHRHAYDDAQLALYSQMLPGEFIHYGYFDDVHRVPEEMSFAELARAQVRYAELLLDVIGGGGGAVLDIGCGMGGLCRMLVEGGFSPVALTPDRLQAAHIASAQPQVPVVRCKFEKLAVDDHRGRYDVAITSESFQYLKLDSALPVMSEILKPGGRWIISDYFGIQPSADRSCHVWSEFCDRMPEAGWKITFQKDITANILPTLSYAHMWASRFGMPFFELAALRLRRKQPGLHHLFSNVLEELRGVGADNLRRIDPDWFAKNRKYVVVAVERS